jgi:V/A-type H+-transporting ATPase subunit I
MIVPMKKITLLCMESEQENTLKQLQRMGVVHIEPVQRPMTEGLVRLHAEIDKAQHALSILSFFEEPAEAEQQRSLTGPESVEHVLSLNTRKQELRDKARALQDERDPIAPFGEFDPQTVKRLKEHGVNVRLYHCPGKKLPAFPGEVTVSVVSRRKSGIYFVALSNDQIEIDCPEIHVPSRSLSKIEKELAQVESELGELDSQLAKATCYAAQIREHISALRSDAEFVEAREGMGYSPSLAYLQGYCPVDRIEQIREKARESGWGLVTEDPEDSEQAPTLLRHPKWVRPVKSVLGMLSILPGYKEVDISSIFLVALTVFFAMIVGDAGYGAVFLVITLLAAARSKKIPGHATALLLIFSISTIIWGGLNGNWFGIPPDKLSAPLSFIYVPWLRSREHTMKVCFLVGAVHLTIAHGWRAFCTMNSLRALAQLGWVLITWASFFLASTMVLSEAFPPFAGFFIVIGILLVLLFQTPLNKIKQEWISLATLPLDVISDFVDLMSYIRLFAVGTATLAIAKATNDMTQMVGFDTPWMIFFSVLILCIGHGLNIVLTLLSVLVHGVRLNALEYSGHMGIEWKGRPYSPFGKAPDEAF